jgi:hypothetical protein
MTTPNIIKGGFFKLNLKHNLLKPLENERERERDVRYIKRVNERKEDVEVRSIIIL